ncbi:4-hydroxy-tetrahydrodipicolinate reductase [Sinanaerobacter sp. ZZT-01]|uniref:4-hydroxy-tetrahydrodipicolinate reductase n=1 Tax=Sinanaerobacter sp. ZZT-01 TaxID=3111540 RepID=UPI002D77BFB0|nr:4-hydroxy-tetrahydrodipicolinate reductase [Sinanaerobacter sp. ZZT-01]WRR94129.1 4-hydroxy-tetrahydrodipicolinate reductase [Sinanaerobacter sp. ZZT-01]
MSNKKVRDQVKTVIVGAGRTGKEVRKKVDEAEDMELIGVVTRHGADEKCLDSLAELEEIPEVIIDFSKPERLDEILHYAESNSIPLILGTTAYSEEQKNMIYKLSEKIPIVYTSNFSLGITVLKQVLKQITPILKEEFDIEVEEMHHSAKLDSPSGTTKMLLETLNKEQEYKLVYGRNGNERRGKEIGVHSLRGGTVAGQHNIVYAGEDELLQISHQAHSNSIFAKGAVKAAKFILQKRNGIYDMSDVLFERKGS